MLNGIWESSTRKQNGHFQSGNQGPRPLPSVPENTEPWFRYSTRLAENDPVVMGPEITYSFTSVDKQDFAWHTFRLGQVTDGTVVPHIGFDNLMLYTSDTPDAQSVANNHSYNIFPGMETTGYFKSKNRNGNVDANGSKMFLITPKQYVPYILGMKEVVTHDPLIPSYYIVNGRNLSWCKWRIPELGVFGVSVDRSMNRGNTEGLKFLEQPNPRKMYVYICDLPQQGFNLLRMPQNMQYCGWMSFTPHIVSANDNSFKCIYWKVDTERSFGNVSPYASAYAQMGMQLFLESGDLQNLNHGAAFVSNKCIPVGFAMNQQIRTGTGSIQTKNVALFHEANEEYTAYENQTNWTSGTIPPAHCLSFNCNGGSIGTTGTGRIDSKWHEYYKGVISGTKIGLMPIPKNGIMTFAGWSVNDTLAQGGTLVNEDTIWTSGHGAMLYANWQ